ncbi:hypothetical protein HDV00_002802 [Rhizophlyctis rosea]|nr:hypothetical protein HDV00_002802 [Rhizophlyctis rosea]
MQARGGIGYHTTLRYAARGARVIAVARRKHLLDALTAECQSFPACKIASSVAADVTNEDDVKRIAAAAKQVLGGCDTVVINAGVLSVLPFRDLCKLDISEGSCEDKDGNNGGESGFHSEGWEKVTAVGADAIPEGSRAAQPLSVSGALIDKMFKTNVMGPIYVAKHFTDLLIESGGKFVVVSSLAGVLAAPTRSIYTSTKFALTGFFTALRIELAKHNVAVCLIYPGSVATDLRHSAVDAVPTPPSGITQTPSTTAPPQPDPSAPQPPARKRITPEQCADAIVEAGDERANETFVPAKYWVGAVVRPIWPGLVDYFAAKKYGYS